MMGDNLRPVASDPSGDSDMDGKEQDEGPMMMRRGGPAKARLRRERKKSSDQNRNMYASATAGCHSRRQGERVPRERAVVKVGNRRRSGSSEEETGKEMMAIHSFQFLISTESNATFQKCCAAEPSSFEYRALSEREKSIHVVVEQGHADPAQGLPQNIRAWMVI